MDLCTDIIEMAMLKSRGRGIGWCKGWDGALVRMKTGTGSVVPLPVGVAQTIQSQPQSSWELSLFGGDLTVDLNPYREVGGSGIAASLTVSNTDNPRLGAPLVPRPQPQPSAMAAPRLQQQSAVLPASMVYPSAAFAPNAFPVPQQFPVPPQFPVTALASASGLTSNNCLGGLVRDPRPPQPPTQRQHQKQQPARREQQQQQQQHDHGQEQSLNHASLKRKSEFPYPSGSSSALSASSLSGSVSASAKRKALPSHVGVPQMRTMLEQSGQGSMLTTSTRHGERSAAFGDALARGEWDSVHRYCRNAGATPVTLQLLVEKIMGAKEVGVAILWRDLTSNHESVNVKYCTPTKNCTQWFCSCDRHIRAAQSEKPLLGALFNIECKEEVDDDPKKKAEREKEADRVYLLPLAFCDGEEGAAAAGDTLPMRAETSLSQRWDALSRIFNHHTPKIFYNAKLALLPLVRQCELQGICVAGWTRIVDLRTAAFLQDSEKSDEKRHHELELEYLFQHSQYLPPAGLDEAAMGGRLSRAVVSLKDELVSVRHIMTDLRRQLEASQAWKPFLDIEMPLLVALARAEVTGVAFRVDAMTALEQLLNSRITFIEEEKVSILRSLGPSGAAIAGANLKSPEQVANMLFDVLRIPPPSGTSSGKGKHLSTADNVLQQIKHLHPIVPLLIDYRALIKVITAFTQGLKNFLKRDTAVPDIFKLHAEFNTLKTRTGRLSCCKPNLQQIPKPYNVSGIDINLRSFIIPSATRCLFVAADYSQIEMRILAHFCRDKKLGQLFWQRGDVYKMMGGLLFSKSPEYVTDEERGRAKTVALGVIYGLGADNMAKQMRCTPAESSRVMEQFFRTFSGAKDWIYRTKSDTAKKGYVQTLLNFRRLLPDILSQEPQKKAEAQRQAVNTIIQGSGADVIKRAMVCMELAIARNFASVPISERPRMNMTVHDELVYEVREDMVQAFVPVLKGVMENQITSEFGFIVPLVVNVEVGPDWGSLVPWAESETAVSDVNVDYL